MTTNEPIQLNQMTALRTSFKHRQFDIKINFHSIPHSGINECRGNDEISERRREQTARQKQPKKHRKQNVRWLSMAEATVEPLPVASNAALCDCLIILKIHFELLTNAIARI